MKINRQYYDRITSEPFEVQELKNGGKVELHSLNDNEDLYNELAPKAKFAMWSSKDGVNYRLVLEDGYYEVEKELYGRRVNQRWLDFWDNFEAGRRKYNTRVIIPAFAIAMIGAIVLLIFAKQIPTNVQYIILAVIAVLFAFAMFFSSRKTNALLDRENNGALEDIKNIIGHERFEELMNLQQVYYDKFFGLDQEQAEGEEPQEETQELEAPAEEKQEEFENSEAAQESEE